MIASCRLEEAGRDRDADTHQNDAAEDLAPFADPGTHKSAEFQPEESHRDADCADENGGDEQGDVIRAQSESDGKVVNAERKPGGEQLPRPRPAASPLSLPSWRNA